MTGGRVVVLGETGRNFAAGMSGGIAYIYDPENKFPDRCNFGMVGLERVVDISEQALLGDYIREHLDKTKSSVAAALLDGWHREVHNFVKVMPHDFKRVLEEQNDQLINDKANESQSQSIS